MSSSGSPMYLVYLYFTRPEPLAPESLVVILLFTAGNLELLVDHRLLAARPAARRGVGRRGVAAFVAPADLALRVEPFEYEVHRRGDQRRRRIRLEAEVVRQLAQALHAGCLRDVVGRRRPVA